MLKNTDKGRFLIIAATHGDEGIGVKVMKEIEKNFPSKKFNYDWVIGNPKAYKKGIRFIRTDLNRSAPGDLKSKIYEERRARELVELSKKYTFVIDLHGTVSNSGIVSIITYPTLENLFLSSIVDVEKNIIWYSPKASIKGPISQHVKCPAIEIEAGPESGYRTERNLYKVIKNLMLKVKNQEFKNSVESIEKKNFYTVYGKVLGKHNPEVKDFQLYKIGKELFYPFLANQYDGILCYKTKIFDIGKIQKRFLK